MRRLLPFLLSLALPGAVSAAPLFVESRVGDGRWTRSAAVVAVAGQPVSLRVAPIRGGVIRWYRIVPDVSAPYNNAVWPWDPGAYRWIGFAKVRYERVEVEPFRGLWEVRLTAAPGAWLAPSTSRANPAPDVASRFPSAAPADVGNGLPPEIGSHWFQVEVELQGRTLASAGLERNDPRGLSPDVLRVTFREGSDLVGHLTGYFNVPGIFGSVPWQVRNYVGVDCADVLMAALALSKGEAIERDYNVAGLTRLLPTVATATLVTGQLSRPLRWGADVHRGDFLAVKYTGWGQFGHVGALYADANGDGLLDSDDLVIHAGPSPLHLSTLGSGAFDGELRFLRPR